MKRLPQPTCGESTHMRLCSITPAGAGEVELRLYEIEPHTSLRARPGGVTSPSNTGCGEVAPQSAIQSAAAASDKKSLAVTAPEVASRILNSCSLRGIRPATYREIAAWRTPIISANLACDIPLLLRNSDSFMADTYHDGMPLQADYANLFFDPEAEVQYRLGMITPPSPLKQLRLKHGLTQEGLAAAIGTQQSQVSRWESEPDPKNPDRSRIPTTWWALKLGELFKVRSTVFIPHIDKKGSLDALLEDAPAHIKAEATEFIMRRLVEQVKADAAAKAAAAPDIPPKRARRPRKT